MSAEPQHETEAAVHGYHVPPLTSEELTIVLGHPLQGAAGKAKPGPIPKLLSPEPHKVPPHQVQGSMRSLLVSFKLKLSLQFSF